MCHWIWSDDWWWYVCGLSSLFSQSHHSYRRRTASLLRVVCHRKQRTSVLPAGLFSWLFTIFHTSDLIVFQKFGLDVFFSALFRDVCENIYFFWFNNHFDSDFFELRSQKKKVKCSSQIKYLQLSWRTIDTYGNLLDSFVNDIDCNRFCVLYNICRIDEI